MAQGIKTVYAIRNSIPKNMLKLLLNAFVFSHLVTYITLGRVTSIRKHLLRCIEKQINWVLKGTFNGRKFDSTKVLKKSTVLSRLFCF